MQKPVFNQELWGIPHRVLSYSTQSSGGKAQFWFLHESDSSQVVTTQKLVNFVFHGFEISRPLSLWNGVARPSVFSSTGWCSPDRPHAADRCLEAFCTRSTFFLPQALSLSVSLWLPLPLSSADIRAAQRRVCLLSWNSPHSQSSWLNQGLSAQEIPKIEGALLVATTWDHGAVRNLARISFWWNISCPGWAEGGQGKQLVRWRPRSHTFSLTVLARYKGRRPSRDLGSSVWPVQVARTMLHGHAEYEILAAKNWRHLVDYGTGRSVQEQVKLKHSGSSQSVESSRPTRYMPGASIICVMQCYASQGALAGQKRQPTANPRRDRGPFPRTTKTTHASNPFYLSLRPAAMRPMACSRLVASSIRHSACKLWLSWS